MNPPASDRIVLPNLNGLRFFAALSVVIYHVYGMGTLNGHYGVVLFFVLSGFLITYLLLTEQDKTSTINIGKFYVRRILRIWPLYYLILLLAGILIYLFHNSETLRAFGANLPYYIFFAPNLLFALDKGSPFADILWSVGSEEQFYLFWPVLLLSVPRAYLMYALIVIIILFTVAPHVLDYINHHYYNNSKSVIAITSNMIQRMCFNAMATGALVSFLYKTKKESISRLFHPVVQVLTVIVLLACWLTNYQFRYFNDEIYSIFFAIIILNLAMNPATLISFNNRVWEYLGKISYGLYVYHLIIIFLVLKYCYYFDASQQVKNLLTLIYTLTGTILISSVSYEFFEKPFLRIKERSFSIIRSGHKE